MMKNLREKKYADGFCYTDGIFGYAYGLIRQRPYADGVDVDLCRRQFGLRRRHLAVGIFAVSCSATSLLTLSTPTTWTIHVVCQLVLLHAYYIFHRRLNPFYELGIAAQFQQI